MIGGHYYTVHKIVWTEEGGNFRYHKSPQFCFTYLDRSPFDFVQEAKVFYMLP